MAVTTTLWTPSAVTARLEGSATPSTVATTVVDSVDCTRQSTVTDAARRYALAGGRVMVTVGGVRTMEKEVFAEATFPAASRASTRKV